MTLTAATAAVRLPATISATVAPIPDGGLVTFTDEYMPIQGCNGVPVDTVTGIATCTTPYYSFPDERRIGATFSGTDAFSAGTAADITLRIAADITVTADVNPSGSARTVVLTATVSPPPGYGTFTFAEGSAPISGCTDLAIPGTGIVTCPITFLTLGDHSITVDVRDIDGAVINRVTHVQTVSALPAQYPAGVGSFTVPDGWADVRIEAWGAEGQQWDRGSQLGFDGIPGKGGGVSVVVSASPGDRFDFTVGAQGNGGWAGGHPGRGRTGGAATSVTTGAELLLVAGGGGGVGGWAYGALPGGNGGADTTTGAGQTAPNPYRPGGGAVGATPGTGAPGATGDFGQFSNGLDGSVWADGGKGGTGGGYVSLGHEVGCTGGGGGGDGYAGGGGGGGCAGSITSMSGAGGGGSSYFNPAVAGVYLGTGERGDGNVSFSHAATQLVFATSTGPLEIGGTRSLTATLTDSAGNVVDTGPDSVRPVTFAQTSGTGAVTGTLTVTAVAGVATATATASGFGSVTLRATAGALSSNDQAFNIPKTAQTITFDVPVAAQSYGTSFVVTPVASSGLVVQLAASGGCTALAAAGSVTITVTSGTTDCTLTATQTGSANYAAATVERVVAVSKAAQPAIVITGPQTAAYGTTVTYAGSGGSGAEPLVLSASGTACVTDHIDGDELSVRMTSGTGTCAISATRAADGDYQSTSTALAVQPTKLTAHVNAIASTAVYGQPTPTLAFALTGLLAGDHAGDVAGTANCTRAAGTDVGTYSITCAPGSLASNDYVFSAGSSALLSVTPAPVTVLAGDATMVYGQTVPAISFGYNGLTGGDTALAVVPSCSVDVPASGLHAGSADTSCTGAADSNYDISYASGTLTVTRAALRVTASSASQIYGEPAPVIVPSYAGFVAGDDADDLTHAAVCTTLTFGTGSYASTCSGAVSSDYTISYDGGVVSVTPAPLTITASSITGTYGVTLPAVTPEYSGFVNGDDAAVLATAPTCGTAADAHTPVGLYPSECEGAAADNYTISYATGLVTIGRAELVITASAATAVYGSASPTITAAYAGFANNEDAGALSTLPSCASASGPASTVGTYPSVCAGAVAENYSIRYVDGVVTVTPAPLTIIASGASQVFGDPAPAIAASYQGFVAGDDAADLDDAAECRANTTATTPVGSGTSSCDSATSNNYDISYVTGVVTVTPATLTITASDTSSNYGSRAHTVTPSYLGWRAGNSVANLTSAATCVANTDAHTLVGSYESTCSGASAANYTIEYVAGRAVVAPAVLTVTASDGTQVYGSAAPVIVPGYTGFVNGEDTAALAASPQCVSGTDGTTGTGTYVTTCAGASAANYTIGYLPGVATVTPAPLTVRVIDATRVAGSPNPAFGARGDGLVNGDALTDLMGALTFHTTATGSSAPGQYAVSVAGLSSPNYSIAFVPGTLTVTAAPISRGPAAPPLTPQPESSAQPAPSSQPESSSRPEPSSEPEPSTQPTVQQPVAAALTFIPVIAGGGIVILLLLLTWLVLAIRRAR